MTSPVPRRSHLAALPFVDASAERVQSTALSAWTVVMEDVSQERAHQSPHDWCTPGYLLPQPFRLVVKTVRPSSGCHPDPTGLSPLEKALSYSGHTPPVWVCHVADRATLRRCRRAPTSVPKLVINVAHNVPSLGSVRFQMTYPTCGLPRHMRANMTHAPRRACRSFHGVLFP